MKDARPEVPWQKIHGLGNLLRHEYRHIDPEVLWSIVTGPLGALDRAAALLEQLENRPPGRQHVNGRAHGIVTLNLRDFVLPAESFGLVPRAVGD